MNQSYNELKDEFAEAASRGEKLPGWGTKRMDPEIKERWLQALRSGDFDQTDGYLTRVDVDGNKSYCCLGVLSKLAADQGVCEVADWSLNQLMYDQDIATLPASVLQWSGIGDVFGDIAYTEEGDPLPTEFLSLTGLNDSGHDFATIANIIELYF